MSSEDQSGLVDDIDLAAEVASAGRIRTQRLIDMLRGLDPRSFDRPSRLPGWTRTTIVCHLRYGTHALLNMTADTLAGRATAYYPEGRAAQRPTTLCLAPGEEPDEVIDEWAGNARQLDRLWASLSASGWATAITEPAGNRDLGPVPIARLALARLTEVDVHGVDLGIGFPDWSDTLIKVALPTRLAWLPTRRSNHRPVDASVQGSWRLLAQDFDWIVTVDADQVTSLPARNGAVGVRATIRGDRRDLLALLLGRPPREQLSYDGDVEFAAAFARAFPGP